MSSNNRLNSIKFNGYEKGKLIKWKIKKGTNLIDGTILFTYYENGLEKKFKSEDYGTVVNLLINENEFINPGQELIEYEKCAHTTVMKDLCAECGMDLRKTDNYENNASVSMIHSVPELKVSYEQAQQLGKADEEKLLSSRKLVLLVDLDQTLIHTTNQPNNQINSKDVISFRLYSTPQLYYTKLRPFTMEFLESISKYYELHICTFGARMYAHKIAEILDPDKKLFSHRILSRDECFDPQLKTGNLKALFPCGDSMVCIIDDREDVWNYQPNLISVKPYNYFNNTGDINSPNKQKDELLAKAAKVLMNKNKVVLDEEEDDELEVVVKEQQNVDNKEVVAVVVVEEEEEVKEKEDIKMEEEVEENNKEEEKEIKKDEKEEIKKEDKKEDEEEIKKEDKKEDKKDKDVKLDELSPKTPPLIDSLDNDDYLLYLPDILKRIHRKFYKEYDEIIKYSAEGEHVRIPDLKNLIPSIRREVLKGCNIVFTGLIPTKLRPEDSKLWIVAKQLGANISRDIVKDGSPLEKTTHLIASNLNTQKVQEALKLKKIHVVNPLWLYTCTERWERVDERLFQIEKGDDFRNSNNLKNKLTNDQQLFLNYDLVKLAKSSLKQKDKLEQQQSTSQNTINKSVSNLKLNNPFPIYDQVTGKLVRPKEQQSNSTLPSTSRQLRIELNKEEEENSKNEDDLTPHSMIEISPLSAFSTTDFKMMNQEVDDACSDEDEDSSDSLEEQIIEENEDSSASSEPKLIKKKKELEDNSDVLEQEIIEENEVEEDDDEENNEFYNDYGDEPVFKKQKKEIECLSESSEDTSNLSFGDSNSNAELAAALEKDFLS